MDWNQSILEGVNYLLNKAIEYLTLSPRAFAGGALWSYATRIFNAFRSVGAALLVLCFVIGVLKTYGSFQELRRPEAFARIWLRFILAYGFVFYGFDVLSAFVDIFQGVAARILGLTGNTSLGIGALPKEVLAGLNGLNIITDFLTSFAIFVCVLVIFVSALVILLTVFGRFFRIYMHIAIAPIPMATVGGSPTQSIGLSFLKSFLAVCLEVALIMLAIMLYITLFQNQVIGIELFDTTKGNEAFMANWIVTNMINMLILASVVKTTDNLAQKWLRV